MAATPPEPVLLRWLDQAPPALGQGVSWGVPWAIGTFQKEQSFALAAADGKALPLQSWPLAYWQDGSVKWMALPQAHRPAPSGPFTLTAVAKDSGQPAGAATVKVLQSNTTYEIDTGRSRPASGNGAQASSNPWSQRGVRSGAMAASFAFCRTARRSIPRIRPRDRRSRTRWKR